MTECSSYDIALKINNVLSKIQAELRCGVCRSTFSNPVSATCNHVFCKNCLDQVFQRQRTVECPICRKKINKRSCTASEQHESIVKGYLQIGYNFRCDLQEQTFSIPKDIAYIESQVPAAFVSNSPLHDFRPTPQFALPKFRARRKHSNNVRVHSKVSKLDETKGEDHCKDNISESSKRGRLGDEDQVFQKSNNLSGGDQSDNIQHESTKSVHVQCNIRDPFCTCQNLRKSIDDYRKRSTMCPSDLHAVFELIPELRDLLAENTHELAKIFKLQEYDCNTTLESVQRCPVKRSNLQRKMDHVDRSNGIEVSNGFQVQTIEELGKSSNSSSLLPKPPSLEVAHHSYKSREVDVSDDNMNITIQMAFESYPDDEEKENVESSTSIVISISRPTCIEDEVLVQRFLSMFPKVQYREEIDSSSTHLIMMNADKTSCSRKSLRYLFAVAHKCEVVVREWLEECVRSQTLCATTSFEFGSSKADVEPGWIRARRTHQPLFGQMSFFLPHMFSDSRLLPRTKLKELIEICGGVCYDKPWDIEDSESSYTIFMPQSTEVNAARRYQASMRGVPVVTADWVLDSIAEYRIMPLDSYKVCLSN